MIDDVCAYVLRYCRGSNVRFGKQRVPCSNVRFGKQRVPRGSETRSD